MLQGKIIYDEVITFIRLLTEKTNFNLTGHIERKTYII